MGHPLVIGHDAFQPSYHQQCFISYLCRWWHHHVANIKEEGHSMIMMTRSPVNGLVYCWEKDMTISQRINRLDRQWSKRRKSGLLPCVGALRIDNHLLFVEGCKNCRLSCKHYRLSRRYMGGSRQAIMRIQTEEMCMQWSGFLFWRRQQYFYCEKCYHWMRRRRSSDTRVSIRVTHDDLDRNPCGENIIMNGWGAR